MLTLTPEQLESIYHEIGLTNMSAEDKMAVIKQLSEHFHQIILDTTIANFNQEQIDRFRRYTIHITDINLVNQELRTIAAEVPGLNTRIMQAVRNEVERLKAASNIVK